MASQDARFSKFEADFKRQQSKMTNKIDTVLRAITDRMAGALPSDTVKNPKLNVNSTTSFLLRKEEREREGNPEGTDTIAHNEEQRDTPQLELIDTTVVDNLGPNRDDEGIEWLDVEEPLDLVDTKWHVFVGNMSYVMDFTILENIETNIDPSLSNIVFGRPLVEISCLVINRKYGEDDYDRGCRKPSDLEDGFYKDTIKLGPEYVTGMYDEGEVTSKPESGHSEHYFDDVSEQDEGHVLDLEDTDNAHIPKVKVAT
ncbi:hypothetical protein Tco_0367072 [Tanacetum coccineum]